MPDVERPALLFKQTLRGWTCRVQQARANAEFRLLFADRIHRHLFNSGPLTPARAVQIWKQRSDVVDAVIAAESARWGDHRRDVLPRNPPNEFYTPNNHYFPEQTRLLTRYFPVRTEVVLQQYEDAGLILDPSGELSPVFFRLNRER